MNLDQIYKWMLEKIRAEQVYEKNEVICLVSMLPSWVMVLKLCADHSEKVKSVKVIYIYASENSYYSLSENYMAYRGLSHHLWDISN